MRKRPKIEKQVRVADDLDALTLDTARREKEDEGPPHDRKAQGQGG